MEEYAVIEGTWEEIVLRAEELGGKRLRLTVLGPVPTAGDIESSSDGPQHPAEAFRTWAGSHPRTTPLLSDEAISRESIYGDHG